MTKFKTSGNPVSGKGGISVCQKQSHFYLNYYESSFFLCIFLSVGFEILK